MTEQRDPTLNQDPEIAHLESCFSDMYEGDVKEPMDIDIESLQKIEKILEETESAETVAFVISGMVGVKDEEPWIPSLHLDTRVQEIIDNAIQKDIFYQKPKIAEECILKNIELDNSSVVEDMLGILEGIGERDDFRGYRFSGRPRIKPFVNKLLDGECSEKAFSRIIPRLPDLPSFYRDPDFVIEVFKRIFRDVRDRNAKNRGDKKKFIENLVGSERLYKEYSPLATILRILSDEMVITGVEIDMERFLENNNN